MRDLVILILTALLSTPVLSQTPPESPSDDASQAVLQLPHEGFPQLAVPPEIPDSVVYGTLSQTWADAWVNSSRKAYTYTPSGAGYNREIIGQSWDSTEWVNKTRGLQDYDAEDNYVRGVSQRWTQAGWENINLTENVYANGLRTEHRTQKWSGDQWVNFQRILYAYDGQGRYTEWLYQDGVADAWTNAQLVAYTYYTNGNDSVTTIFRWVDSAWVNNSRSSYSYDEQERRISSLYQLWRDNAWLNADLYLTTYDGSGNREVLRQEWRDTSWFNRYRHLILSDADGRLLEDAKEDWVNDTWVKDFRNLYAYDSLGYQVEYISQHGEGDSWVNGTRSRYPHDVNGHETYRLTERWDGTEWQNLFQTWTTWGPWIVAGVDHGASAEFTFRLSSNYPNPFNPSTTIEYALPHSGYATLRIYNVLGEEVATLVDGDHAAGTFTATWDASDLPSGVYFYRLTAGEYVQTRKMVSLR